jgi:acetylornithine deacetylase
MAVPQQIRARVLATIDAREDERVRFLQDLVRIPSGEGDDERIVAHMAAALRGFGADAVDQFRPESAQLRQHPGYSPVHPEHSSRPGGEAPVVVATFKGAGGGKSLMFYGHLETATPAWEPAVVELMRYNPWEGVVVDGKLYGRGAYNMKSGDSAAILALRCIREAGVHLKGDVLFNFNTDEDVGSNGALASVLKGYTADAGINPEPSSLWICPSTGGPLWFRVEVTGRSSFGGWASGVNPIDKAVSVYQAIRDYGEYRKQTAHHPLYDDLPNPAPLSVGVLRAGNWPSNVPQVAVIEGRIGCLPGEDLDAVQREFEDRLRAVAEADDWLRQKPPRVTWLARWEPVLTPLDHPIVQTCAQAYRAVVEQEPVISGKTAGNDMTKLTAYGGIPSVNWGPSGGPFGYKQGTTDHSPDAEFDEFVLLDSYHELTRMFALTLLEWCGVA